MWICFDVYLREEQLECQKVWEDQGKEGLMTKELVHGLTCTIGLSSFEINLDN